MKHDMDHKKLFFEKINKNGPIVGNLDACWIWEANKSHDGYGLVKIKQKTMYTHKVLYEWENGKVPDGHVLDHLCKNRSCCNPKHIEIVTQRENVIRGSGIAAKYAQRTHCQNGHEFNKENTRIETSGARRCRICAKQRAKIERAKKNNHVSGPDPV